MKNTLSVIFDKSMIVMDRTFAKLAANTNSKEYEKLQQVRRDYPNFVVTMRKIKKNENKVTYKGLTYQYMKSYILSHGSCEMRAENLKIFEELLVISKCHEVAKRYPVIKAWFLETYPEIARFGMKPIEMKSNEIAYEAFDNFEEEDCYEEDACENGTEDAA